MFIKLRATPKLIFTMIQLDAFIFLNFKPSEYYIITNYLKSCLTTDYSGFYILNEPTQGISVSAQEEVMHRFNKLFRGRMDFPVDTVITITK